MIIWLPECVMVIGTNQIHVVVAGYVVGTIVATRAGYRVGRNSFVRCRAGHLFTTTWIPGGSLKAIRLGLWRIQFQSLTNYLDGTRTPAQVRQAVTADVRRAARLIDTGLSSFAAFAPGIFAHAPTVQGEA